MTQHATARSDVIGIMVERTIADSASDAARAAARAAILDTVGVGLAAAREESVGIVNAVISDSKRGTGGVPVWCDGSRAPAAAAALVNAVASHALDYDDVSHGMKGHPSAVIVPALLALADQSDCSGTDVLDAYVTGVDIACGVGAGLDMQALYGRGWHLTSVLGVLGATAACARVSGLRAAQTRAAFAIAASSASGLRANFGSMTKHLHVGNAAASAVQAVQLASAGFTAADDAVGGPAGFLAVFGGSRAEPAAVADALDAPAGTYAQMVNTKKYPCCYQTHRAVDAACHLRSQVHDLTSVAAITATTEPDGTNSLLYPVPSDPTQARFSMPYAIATALRLGSLGFDAFSPEEFQRTLSGPLLEKVSVASSNVPPSGATNWKYGYAVVEIAMADGSYHFDRVDIPRGDHRDPLTAQDRRQKFRDCVQYGRRQLDTEKLLSGLETLDDATSVRATTQVIADDIPSQPG